MYSVQKRGFSEDGTYTARVRVTLANKDEHLMVVVYGKKVPSDPFFVREIERRIALLEAFVPLEDEKIFTDSEVTLILRDKGYLTEEEEFSESLPIKIKEIEIG